jgi:hypothetical protein
MKIPNLASSNQAGAGRASMDSQVGWNMAASCEDDFWGFYTFGWWE